MADTVFLRHLSRWQAEQQREAFADLYVEAYGGGSVTEFNDRQDFLWRFADYVQHPGFDMMIASEAGAVVGCVCGFRTDRGDSSWPGHEDLTSDGQVFTVVEVMVLPSHRRRRVATRLLEQLLTRAGAALATARVQPTNAPALAAYRSWGWTRAEGSEGPLAAGGSSGGSSEPYETWSHSRT
ncbi:GNAT family N-acetyltransferase [Actinacidiphila soli]|jgi:GNAT superfamily N-acetyltransferase|uniref:GNAT family N-acetyltransferase n=1 Tax=Actinacidiphila soli TaxID=2487275 RepID=UPI0013E29479|nr:GNAT family N-acetyltransferase [Actinacidiphila soli]